MSDQDKHAQREQLQIVHTALEELTQRLNIAIRAAAEPDRDTMLAQAINSLALVEDGISALYEYARLTAHSDDPTLPPRAHPFPRRRTRAADPASPIDPESL